MAPMSPPYYLTTIGFAGLQVAFTAVTGYGVSHLRSLGLSQFEIAGSLLTGPVCGAIFPPLFGVWSDRLQSRWGRRKPFVFAGTCAAIVTTLMVAWLDSISRSLASWLVIDQQHLCTTMVVLLSIVMWTGLQAVQVGLRALVTDGLDSNEQADANAWASYYARIAAAIASLVMFLDDTVQQKFDDSVFKDISVLAAALLFITVAVSCYMVDHHDSRKLVELDVSSKSSNAYEANATDFRQIKMVCLIQVLSWTGWFPVLFYTKSYITSLREAELRISQGDTASLSSPSSMGSLALFTNSLMALAAALMLPRLLVRFRSFDMRQLWIFSLVLFSVTILGSEITTSSVWTIMMFTIVGFSWAVSNWVPYALLGAEIASQEPQDPLEVVTSSDDSTDQAGIDLATMSNKQCAGLVYGMHNLAICIPQMLMSVGAMVMWSMQNKPNTPGVSVSQGLSVRWLFRTGGMLNLIAAYFAFRLHDTSSALKRWDYVELEQYTDDREQVKVL